jgi:hypothetical protein
LFHFYKKNEKDQVFLNQAISETQYSGKFLEFLEKSSLITWGKNEGCEAHIGTFLNIHLLTKKVPFSQFLTKSNKSNTHFRAKIK